VRITPLLWSLGLVGCSFGAPDLPIDGSPRDGEPRDIDAAEPPDGWPLRRRLAIDNGDNGAIAMFPLPVFLTPSRIDYTRTLAGGADLRFGDAAGAFYPYEIEQWSPGGTSVAWVRVPVIPLNGVAELYVYYGNPAATDAQSPADVWDDDYVGVWHMANGADASQQLASTLTGAGGVAGAIGPALDFSGTNQFIDTTSSELLAEWTVEVWMYPDGPATPGGARAIVSRFPNYMLLWGCESQDFCRTAMLNIEGSGTTVTAAFDAPMRQWSYVVGRFTGEDLRTFVGGIGAPAVEVEGLPQTSNATAKIGTRQDGEGDFDGKLDEVRISRVPRSDSYIRATHRAATDDYVTFEAEHPNPN
jgi:biopolymer transport protein ExbB